MKRALILLVILLFLASSFATYFIVIQNKHISTLKKEIDSLDIENINLQQQNDDLKLQTEDSKNKQDEILAEKVITQSYKQFNEAGSFSRKDFETNIDNYFSEYYAFYHNMGIVSNSYNNGKDADVKHMLNAINEYLDTIWIGELEYDAMTDAEKSDYWGTKLINGVNASATINNCISKYALFDEIGLKETS